MTVRRRASSLAAVPIWLLLTGCGGASVPTVPTVSTTAPAGASATATSSPSTTTPATTPSLTNAPALTSAQALAQSLCATAGPQQVVDAFTMSKVDEVSAGEFDVEVLPFDTCLVQGSSDSGYVQVYLGWSAITVTSQQFAAYRTKVESESGQSVKTTSVGSSSFTFVNGASALVGDRVATVFVRTSGGGGEQSAAVLAAIASQAKPPTYQPARTIAACQRAGAAVTSALGTGPQVVRGSTGKGLDCGWWAPTAALEVSVTPGDGASAEQFVESIAKNPTSKKVSGLGKAARYGAFPRGTVLVVHTKADALVIVTVPPGRVPTADVLAKVVKALGTP